MQDRGYRYGTLIYLYPEDPRRMDRFPRLDPDDVVLLTTRPPLDNHGESVRNTRAPKLPANGSELEHHIFAVVRESFSFCTRRRIGLSRSAATSLRCADARKWHEIELRTYRHQDEPGRSSSGEMTEIDALLKLHHLPHGDSEPPPEPPPYRSVAFLLRRNGVPGLGCDLIVSFGMDGYTTLIWNRILRNRHPDWLLHEGFLMAELSFTKDIPNRPLTPAFADNEDEIHVRLLTEIPGPGL